MKHFYIKCILLCLLTFISISVLAYDCEVDGIYYYLNDNNTASVTRKSDNGDRMGMVNNGEYTGSVEIPSSIMYKGVAYNVTKIEEYAFAYCSELTSVTIPNSVTYLAAYAFIGCSGLTSVIIPNSVIIIGIGAFSGCSGLTSVTIGNSVKTIDNYAFDGCKGLTELLIPKSVNERISTTAFRGCSGLTSIVVDENNPTYDSREDCNAIIQTASNNLIVGCSSTVIPNSVTSIDEFAFTSREGLTSIIIPNGVTSIGQFAFATCKNLTSVHITDLAAWCNILFNDSQSQPLYYAHHLYLNGQEVTNLVIPNSVTSIKSYAFEGCSGLTSVTIPNSVTSIKSYAFRGCSGLTSVTIPNSVTSIGNYAFEDCSSLTTVTIPNSVISIGNSTFAKCDALVSVTVKLANPIDISNDVFSQKTYQSGTLYVPKGREQYYKDAIGWKNFSNIEGIDMTDVEIIDNPFADLGSNQMILGYYRSNECVDPNEEYAYGGANKGTYKVCIGFDKEKIEPFVGNKITHVRFALVNTNITEAKIWISKTRDGNALYTQRVPSLTTEWNEVKLDTPFEIMNDSIFIGLEYYQDAMNYPISCVSTGAEYGSRLFWGPYGDSGEPVWLNDSGKYALSLQCLIEGDKIPEYDIHISTRFTMGNHNNRVIKSGQELEGTIFLKNWGKKGIDNYELVYLLDGKEVKTYQGSMLVGSSIRSHSFSFAPQNLAAGKHTITATVKSINGQKPVFTADDTLSAVVKIYANDIERQKVLMEEHTATWCPYSIISLDSYKRLAQDRDDVAFVFIHHSDELSCDAGEVYGVFTNTVPTTDYNRYADFGQTHLGYTSLDESKTMPSFANVNISADYNDKTRQLMIKVSGEKNEDFELLEEYTNLTVLLTEDDVVARQYDGINDKYIYDFKHQAVLRTNVSAVWGDSVVWDGDKYEMNYTVTLDDGWEKDNMKIVAFLAKPFNGSNYDEIYVVNCNDFAVKDATSVDIVDLMASEVSPFDVYSLSGVLIKQKVTSTKGLPKGVYIVNGKKVLVNQ